MNLSELGLQKKDIAALKKKHIYTTDDLLMRLPRKYMDYREIKVVKDCINGEYSAVSARLINTEIKQGSKMKYLRLNMISGDDRLRVDFYVGKYSGYLQRQYSPYTGMDVVVTGKVSVDPVYGISISDPEVVPGFRFSPGIVPVYPKNGSMKQEDFLFWLEKCMEMQGEILEKDIRETAGILPYKEALKKIHHPETPSDIDRARKQLIFNDLLWFELKRKDLESGRPDTTSVVLKNVSTMKRFVENLSFELTSAKNTDGYSGGQKEVIDKLLSKASSGDRIEAVIEGDVGCGKTAVAGAMAMLAAGNGYQALIIAPKTVLAQQHAKEIGAWCEKMDISYEILVGTPKTAEEKRQKKEALKRIKDGSSKIIIGTHACFSKDVEYKNVGIVIIDEEQQFGVEQKSAAREKALTDAHYIEMSATPVPRSLALSIYGNKEVFRVTKKPEGRKPVQTAACSKEETAMRFAEKQLAEGRQCYVVVPMIDENEDDGIDGVKKTAERLKKRFGKLGYTVVSADGKMKEEDFSKAISDFKDNRAQVLVATTVVEVGVNIPNATVMIIENAERFGLSQLHQLRGRVGRREYSSYCIMVTDDRQNERVRVMESTTDGFEIAEKDLLLRGPGDVNGLRQSGQNKYVTEALLFPDIHKKAREAAKMCNDENKNAVFLKMKYEEHESFERPKT